MTYATTQASSPPLAASIPQGLPQANKQSNKRHGLPELTSKPSKGYKKKKRGLPNKLFLTETKIRFAVHHDDGALAQVVQLACSLLQVPDPMWFLFGDTDPKFIAEEDPSVEPRISLWAPKFATQKETGDRSKL